MIVKRVARWFNEAWLYDGDTPSAPSVALLTQLMHEAQDTLDLRVQLGAQETDDHQFRVARM